MRTVFASVNSMLSGIVAATEGANSIGEIMLGYPSTSLGSDVVPRRVG